ncbi:MAG TPA: hypothetical protein VI589_09210, partial [Vicinamibacteria bacterium]
MIALVLALLLKAPSPPGLYYEQVTESVQGKAPRGQAVRTRVYSLGRRMRLESAEGPAGPAMVLRLDEARAFRLDPASKTARRLDLERLREQSQLDLSAAGEALGAAGEGAVRTTSLPGTRTIAGRVCRGYRIAAPQASLDLYVADLGPGIGIDTFADFLEWSGASLALGPVLDEMRRLPGFPLETRTRARVHGQDVTVVTTVTKIELGPLGPGLFE